jgi:hypothetical protein
MDGGEVIAAAVAVAAAAADLPVAALWIAADVPGFTGTGTGTGK